MRYHNFVVTRTENLIRWYILISGGRLYPRTPGLSSKVRWIHVLYRIVCGLRSPLRNNGAIVTITLHTSTRTRCSLLLCISYSGDCNRCTDALRSIHVHHACGRQYCVLRVREMSSVVSTEYDYDYDYSRELWPFCFKPNRFWTERNSDIFRQLTYYSWPTEWGTALQDFSRLVNGNLNPETTSSFP